MKAELNPLYSTKAFAGSGLQAVKSFTMQGLRALMTSQNVLALALAELQQSEVLNARNNYEKGTPQIR